MNENENVILTDDELDAIGEIMNISMGSSATAVSAMLEKQVTITTPSIRQEVFGNIDSSDMEPAILVKIKYVEGITGTNAIVLRRHDMQVILNLLMGNESDDDDFEFDDMSISAACEVMNQMMGASATALSEILGRTVNISTPVATLPDSHEALVSEFDDITPDQQVVAISFQLSIKDVMNSRFNCYLPTDLARGMITSVTEESMDENKAPASPAAATPAPAAPSQQPAAAAPAPAPAATPAAQAAPAPAAPATAPPMPQQPYPQADPAMMQQPYPQQQYAPYPQQQYAPYPQQQYNVGTGYEYPQAPINVKTPQFPSFVPSPQSAQLSTGNMNLLMSVPLEVSVVIGKARRKIKDIMDFGQGTVIELDKQTGAPAEILVNGQLLAYGDVIVVGDNFGVRITEIVSTQELLDSLNIVDTNI